MSEKIRRCGILLHPTSLPSPFGIGSFGDEAFAFVDLLEKAHVTLWQMLPLGPTGYGDSPYAARSTFAGNELLIDLGKLACDGYLDIEEVTNPPPFPVGRVDYGRVRETKMAKIAKAAARFAERATKTERRRYAEFCGKNSWWLDDYALYTSLCDTFGDSRWFRSWPVEVKMREKEAVAEAGRRNAREIERRKISQYFFFTQYHEMKKYANDHGVKIVGDIPIFVASDSVDVWTNRELFQLDAKGNQTASSGVPPDAFSADGQLWGNPLYDWPAHEKSGFAWWTRRIKAMLTLSDIIRIDHFRGFSACWSVKAGEKTARKGRWEPSPGRQLFRALDREIGANLPIIAEDLGVITREVETLREESDLPGMKILQFAFGLDGSGKLDAENAYLPHNCDYQSVIYTGTHDNNTTRGWYDALDEGVKDKVRRYLECPDDQVVWKLMRSALMAASKYAIFPMQDWLGLGEEARMNVPATCGAGNWSWRLSSLDIPSWRVDYLRDMIDMYGRHQSQLK